MCSSSSSAATNLISTTHVPFITTAETTKTTGIAAAAVSAYAGRRRQPRKQTRLKKRNTAREERTEEKNAKQKKKKKEEEEEGEEEGEERNKKSGISSREASLFQCFARQSLAAPPPSTSIDIEPMLSPSQPFDHAVNTSKANGVSPHPRHQQVASYLFRVSFICHRTITQFLVSRQHPTRRRCRTKICINHDLVKRKNRFVSSFVGIGNRKDQRLVKISPERARKKRYGRKNSPN